MKRSLFPGRGASIQPSTSSPCLLACHVPHRRISSIVFLSLLLLWLSPAFVQAQFNYITNNGAITITRYTGSGGAVTIPSTINGLPVVTIGRGSVYVYPGYWVEKGAFQECYGVTSVTIPNTVTNIEYQAFYFCGLTNVTIPESVVDIGRSAFQDSYLSSVTIPCNTIGYDAFWRCSALTKVTILNTVRNIGDDAFSQCQNLTNVLIGSGATNIGDFEFCDCEKLLTITVDELNPSYSSADGIFFNKRKTMLLQYPIGRRNGSYTIPTGVCGLGHGAFWGCENLTNITFSQGLLTIGAEAVRYCINLTSVTIPNSVTNIRVCAFSGCRNLTNVTIGNHVAYIEGYAFQENYKLTRIYFQGNAPSLGGDIFAPGNANATVYYLLGTTGWSNTFSGLPTTPNLLPNPLILTCGPDFGPQTDAFAFRISWATNATVVVDARSNLTTHSWTPVATNILRMGINAATDGWASFRDSQWTNSPARFYRLRSP